VQRYFPVVIFAGAFAVIVHELPEIL
jgi:hypothetical protein